MTPRLKQPLYIDMALKQAPRGIVLAYDLIWTLIHAPTDIAPIQRKHNTRAVLERLGSVIEAHCGPDVFEYDPRQLVFDAEVIDPKPAPEAQKET